MIDDMNTSVVAEADIFRHTAFSDVDSEMSAELEQLFNDIVGVWLTGFICLIGLTGNSVSFVVLQRAFGSRSPMFYVLRAMSVSDTIFLLTVFIVQTLVNLRWTDHLETTYSHRGLVQYIVWPILMTTQMTTVWLTVLVSCERYVAICRPLDVASVCTVSRVRRAVLVILVTSVLFNVPRYFEMRIDPTGTVLEKSDIGSTIYFRYIYTCVLYSLILFIVPLALLIFLNVQLILALHRGRNEWVNLRVVERREHSLTVIPLTIVVVFFICGTPSLAVNVIDSINYFDLPPAFIPFMLIANVLVVINSASNIIVYCLVGRKFRSKLLEILRCQAGSRCCDPMMRSSSRDEDLRRGGGGGINWSSAVELPSGSSLRRSVGLQLGTAIAAQRNAV